MFLALLLPVLGCAVGDDYQPPSHQFVQTQTQNGWLSLQNANLPVIPPARVLNPALPWWQQLHDDHLARLIQLGLSNNNELKIAEARVAEARANEAVSFAALMPQLSGTLQGKRESSGSEFNPKPFNTSENSLSSEWELDLAGGGRRRHQAAVAAVQAAEASAANLRLALITEVARSYIALRSAQQQYSLTARNLMLQRQMLTAVNAQRALGAISDFEVARAAAQTETTSARLPLLEKSMVTAINRLSVFLAVSPYDLQPLAPGFQTIPNVPMAAVVATPLEAIRNRPDIRVAERQLAEATELHNAAFAGFFPKITLSGFLGVQRDAFGSVTPWHVALNGIMPLLDFGAVAALVDAADARQQQAFYNYRQAVLQALEEMENTLTGYITEARRKNDLQAAAQHQAQAANIVREQYKSGVATQLDLLITTQNELDAQNEAVLSEAAAAENLVLLWRAMGMGI